MMEKPILKSRLGFWLHGPVETWTTLNLGTQEGTSNLLIMSRGEKDRSITLKCSVGIVSKQLSYPVV